MPTTPRVRKTASAKKTPVEVVASPASAKKSAVEVIASPARAVPTKAPTAPAAAVVEHRLPAPSVIPTAVWWWLVVSSCVVIWDGLFVLNRPRSMPGGDLHAIWSPYALYVTIDKMYGDMGNLFVIVQSYCNFVEVALNFLAAYLASHAGGSARKSTFAGVVALVSLAFTFWKTVIYFAYGREDAAHNDWKTYVTLYLLPNGMWLLVPFLSMVAIAHNIVGQVPK
jgi:hypothetical protein